MVLMVSQPAPGMVSVIVAAALKTCLSNVYGKPLAQTSTVTVDVSSGSWLTGMVLMVSQLPPRSVSVCVLVRLKTCTSNVYGKSLAQSSTLTVEVNNGSSLPDAVPILMVSQTAPGIVSVIVAAALKTCLSNVYGKPLAQTSTVTVDVSSGSWLT